MDQPFYTVDNPKFHSLLTYTHHPLPTLKIPYYNAVKRWIMKMGNTIEATKHMFKIYKYLPFLCTQTYNLVNPPGKCWRENQYFPWCMDVKQQLCVLGYCCTLYYQGWPTWYIDQSSDLRIEWLRTKTYFRKTAHWFSWIGRWTLRCQYGKGNLADIDLLWDWKPGASLSTNTSGYIECFTAVNGNHNW